MLLLPPRLVIILKFAMLSRAMNNYKHFIISCGLVNTTYLTDG